MSWSPVRRHPRTKSSENLSKYRTWGAASSSIQHLPLDYPQINCLYWKNQLSFIALSGLGTPGSASRTGPWRYVPLILNRWPNLDPNAEADPSEGGIFEQRSSLATMSIAPKNSPHPRGDFRHGYQNTYTPTVVAPTPRRASSADIPSFARGLSPHDFLIERPRGATPFAEGRMSDPRHISSLIGDIYDAVLDKSLWVGVLAGAAHFVGAQAGALLW